MRYLTAFLMVLAALAHPALAQHMPGDTQPPYPSKPIRILVPFPPGGATDAIARVAGSELANRLKQPVIVDNRPGAGGNIAADQVAKAPPDGYTLLLGTISTNAINESLYRHLPFSARTDLRAIAPLATLPLVLVTSRTDVASVDDLIRMARRAPGTVTYGSPGSGTAPHLAGEIFQRLTQTTLTHVAYKGSGAALTDVMGGRVDVIFDTVIAALPHIRSGRLKALAVTTPEPLAFLEKVPALAQAGVPGFGISAWNGLFAPRGTPDGIVAALNADLRQVMSDPAVRQRVLDIGGIAMVQDAAAFSAFVASEHDKYHDLIQRSRITVD